MLIIPTEMQEELNKVIQSPERAYHNWTHIEEMLEQFDLIQRNIGWSHPHEVYLAMLYHDVIYEFSAKDNEIQSAQHANHEIQKYFSTDVVDRGMVCRLIELTAHHGSLQADDLNPDEQLFLDADMSIVAKDWARFQEYESQIEVEYSHVYPKWMYRMGRRKFLQKVLKQERIFFSDWYFENREQQTRENIQRILNRK